MTGRAPERLRHGGARDYNGPSGSAAGARQKGGRVERIVRWRGAALLAIIALEGAIFALDALVPQDVPISHLFYLPIILAAAAYGSAGAALAAVASLGLFALANYLLAPRPLPWHFLPASALTFLLYLGVGLFAAAYLARQRQVAEIGAQLQTRVAQLDLLYRVAATAAASDALDDIVPAALAAAAELSASPCAGLLPLSPELAAWRYPAPGDTRPPLTPALARRVAEQRQPLALAGGEPGAELPVPWQALLALPLTVGGEVVGALYVADTAPRAYAREERRALETLAQQAAAAIARSRLRAQELDLALSEERNRLAREIHDTLAQSLLAVILQLEATKALLPREPGRAHGELLRAEAAARDALAEARRSVRGLRPAPLERGTLVEALRAELRDFGAREGLETSFAVEGDVAPLPFAVEDGLYGIAREALNNVRKHARAAAVTLSLRCGPDEAALVVRDDGVGFDPAAGAGRDAGHFGLVGMRERARLLGGTLAVTAAAGRGTEVRVRIPLPPAPAERGEQPVRVLLCDDHEVVRRGVAGALLTDPGLAVVGEAGSGAEALERAAQLRPDVVLLDLRLPDLDGVEVTRRLRALRPEIAVVMLTSFGDDPALLEALRAGARGSLVKDLPPAQLAAAIRAVARGEPALAAPVAERLLAQWANGPGEPATGDMLSAREVEVLRLLATGARNKEIARALGVTERTAKAHVSHIMQKLDVADRTAAVTAALRRGLIRL